MDDLTEKVENAYREAHVAVLRDNGDVVTRNIANEAHREGLQAAIRAVLDGIREPDEAMVRAGLNLLALEKVTEDEAISMEYRTMINELRKRYD